MGKVNIKNAVRLAADVIGFFDDINPFDSVTESEKFDAVANFADDIVNNAGKAIIEMIEIEISVNDTDEIKWIEKDGNALIEKIKAFCA